MPVTDVHHDLDTRTLVIRAEFDAPIERVWEVYADPRQLEQVFGPPTYPATFVTHQLTPGGKAEYYMTSPEGEKYYGYWKVQTVDAPNRFTFEDGFASDDAFTPIDDMPVSQNEYAFEPDGARTRATYTSRYDSAEALQKVLDMGMIEGASAAIAQIDTLLEA